MRWMIALILIVVLAIACLGIVLTRLAQAHEWYPQSCCSGQDCEELPVENLIETNKGWQINHCSATRPICISGFVEHGKEKISQDGSYHLCFNSSRIICFFAPVNT